MIPVQNFDRNPDFDFSLIPYVKGCSLLKYLESQIGHDNFQQFFKEYIEEYKFKTISTNQFVTMFDAFCVRVNKKFTI